MSELNRNLIVQNLQETKEELERTIAELMADPAYSEAQLGVALMHAYHHMNVAWNTRAIAFEQYQAMSDSDFNKWSKFPESSDDMSFEMRIEQDKSRVRENHVDDLRGE